MLISLIRNNFQTDAIILVLMMIPIVLISLSFHELSHGYIAYKCGDPTARNLGRLTMNPLKHLDPIGALMMLLIGFGWATPVPINIRNLKKQKQGMALIALAGPVSNLILAFVSVGIMFLVGEIFGPITTRSEYNSYIIISEFFYLFAILNVGLAVFNLIPLPPLDGSRIVSWLLPSRLAYSYAKIEEYTRFIFLGIILSSYIPLHIGRFANLSDLLFYPIDWLRATILDLFFSFFQLFL